jgi:hypothetical protein
MNYVADDDYIQDRIRQMDAMEDEEEMFDKGGYCHECRKQKGVKAGETCQDCIMQYDFDRE